MDTNEAVHAHRDQAHYNGKCYNRTSAIPKYDRIWKYRDSFWLWRNAQACFDVQFLRCYFQCGGNGLETHHANWKYWFGNKWMKHDGLHFIPYALAWQYPMVLKANSTRTTTMQQISASNDGKKKFAPWFGKEEWIDEIHKIYDDANGMNDLKKKKFTECNNFHAYCSFNIDKTLEQDMHGLNPIKCIKRKPAISQQIYTDINILIDKNLSKFKKKEELINFLVNHDSIKKNLTKKDVEKILNIYYDCEVNYDGEFNEQHFENQCDDTDDESTPAYHCTKEELFDTKCSMHIFIYYTYIC